MKMKVAAIIFVFVALLGCGGVASAGGDGSSMSIDLGRNRTLTITERVFDPGQAKIEKCREGAGICRINGGIPFGIGSSMPKTVLAKLVLTVDGKTYDLDASNMYNAWGRRSVGGAGSGTYLAASCYDRENCILRGIFSEAATSYVAEWAIVDGHSSRTMLTGSHDVVDLFQRHIEPPAFE